MHSHDPKKKLLFLDFDGVLHSTTSAYDDLFCKAVLLSDLLAKSPCDVVISSSWRFNYELDHLRSRLPSPLSGMILGKTGDPEVGRWARYMEIKKYMAVNKLNSDWRALDDAFLEFPKECPELILCHPKIGLNNKAIDTLKSWLN